MSEEQTLSPSRFPVSVIMQRQQVQHGPWSAPRWEVLGIVAGGHVGDGQKQRTLIRSEAGVEQYLWSGLTVILHKDDVESYRYNLVATTPSLFIICRPEPESDLSPFLVTADFEAAGFSMERDGTVFSAPMPPEIYRWLEQFVVENYVPPEPPKRKQEKREEQEAYGRQRPPGTERRPR